MSDYQGILPDPITMESCEIGPTGFVVKCTYRKPLEISAAFYWSELAKQGVTRCENCGRPDNNHSWQCEMRNEFERRADLYHTLRKLEREIEIKQAELKELERKLAK